METTSLNHTLSNNDGYGKYEKEIASQVQHDKYKKLSIVNEVSTAGTNTYFKVECNNTIAGTFANYEYGVECYNNLK